MSRIETVAIDVDSVLFPTNRLEIIPALRKSGLFPDVTMDDITTFDYAVCLGSEAKRIAFEVFARPDLYDDYLLHPKTQAALDKLRATYGRVIAVTSPFWQHASSKWSYCLRAGFAHNDIVLAGDKSLVDFDVLIDDRPETALQLGPERVVIFDQPWNQLLDADFVRAYGWGEVPGAIDILQTRREVEDAEPFSGFGAGGSTCIHGARLSDPCGDCGDIEGGGFHGI